MCVCIYIEKAVRKSRTKGRMFIFEYIGGKRGGKKKGGGGGGGGRVKNAGDTRGGKKKRFKTRASTCGINFLVSVAAS